MVLSPLLMAKHRMFEGLERYFFKNMGETLHELKVVRDFAPQKINNHSPHPPQDVIPSPRAFVHLFTQVLRWDGEDSACKKVKFWKINFCSFFLTAP